MYRHTFFREMGNHLEYSRRKNILYFSPTIENIELTSHCNLSCRTCVQKKTPRHLKLDELKYIVHENGYFLTGQHIWLHFNGEPLLNPDLYDAIVFLEEEGVATRLSTNATVLNEEKSLEILDSGLREIVFSIDATTSETFSQIKPGADFLSVIENVNRFLELKKIKGYKRPITQVQFVKHSYNEHEVDDFIGEWKGVDVDYINIKSFSSRAGRVRDDGLYQHGELGCDRKVPCIWPWKSIIIASNGDVTTCCSDLLVELELGNVFDKSIPEIWNGERFRELRYAHSSGSKEPLICENCMERVGYGESFITHLAKEIIGKGMESRHRIIRNV